MDFSVDVLLSHWDLFAIVRYFAFVNQVAGIRKVRETEMGAIEHFVFSGKNVILSKEEAFMIDIWWNFTLVSCVANICHQFLFSNFDSMVFWYCLNPRELQYLLKKQSTEGTQYLTTSSAGVVLRIDTGKYDRDIEQEAGSSGNVFIYQNTEQTHVVEEEESGQI